MPPSPSPRDRFRAGLGWFALALLGLVIAAGVSLAASRLSSQHIGLSSEPLSAGQGLSPATTTTKTTTRSRTTRTSRTKRVPRPAPTITRSVTTQRTTDDHGGRSPGGSGGGDDGGGSNSHGGSGGGGHGSDD